MKFKQLAIGQVFTFPGAPLQFRKHQDHGYVGVHTSHEAINVAPDTVIVGPRNRFDDAIEIQEGAVNVMAIARALVRACEEINEEKPRKGTHEEDPAVRMIVHQLAWLCWQAEAAIDQALYQRMMDECESHRIKQPEGKP